MNIDGISPNNFAQRTDRQAFGALVIAKTMDLLQEGPKDVIPVDKATFGMEVLNKTLAKLNSGLAYRHGMHSSYEFQMDVLSPTYTGQGTTFSKLV